MDKKVQERLHEDFDTFNKVSHQYENEEISANDFRSVSTGFGEYLQRDNAQMLRIRVPGGRIPLDHLKSIIDSCEYYEINWLKITAGQSLQFHDLDPHAGRRLILRLLDAGIVTRGAGGDNPNNISASPLSGVMADDYFDVQPYAEAAEAYLLKYTGIEPLPRKFKISFCSNPKNDTHVTIKDLGFLAKENGKFDIYAIGGLGINPKVGVLTAADVDPSKILYYMRTVLDVYMDNGNYRDRRKARSRFLQDTMGVDGFLKAFNEHLAEVMEQGGLDIDPKPISFTKKGLGELPADLRSDYHIHIQKEKGLCAVAYHPYGGYISLDKITKVYDMIKDWEQVEIRLTNHGGFCVINCNAEEAKQLLPLFADGAANRFEGSVACVGRRRCDIGIADSQALLRACIKAVKEKNFAPGVLPRMHISGCISSCADQPIGTIGWRGARRKDSDGNPQDAYFFTYGGSGALGRENLANSKDAILASRIPDFLIELGQMVQKDGSTFAEWYPSHTSAIADLVARYKA